VDDLAGLKIRTAASNLYVEVMRELGAAVTPLSVGEAYTALQTHLVDGLISPLPIIETLRFYEVQKYLSITNLMWVGQWFYINADAMRALPADIQAVLERNARTYALNQRRDSAALTASLRAKLATQGLAVNDVQPGTFVAKLGPYYARAKKNFGSATWDVLERYSGKLG
jgi:TRAP-type C4-dicarboxylate transport system substrate-binding protein